MGLGLSSGLVMVGWVAIKDLLAWLGEAWDLG